MFPTLLPNLKFIGILLIAFFTAFGTNTILGIYYNVDALKQEFSWKKFWKGILRGGILLLAAAMITIIISCLPDVLESFGITADHELFEGLSMGAIATVILSCIVHYLKDALAKFYKIIHGEDKPEEEKTE